LDLGLKKGFNRGFLEGEEFLDKRLGWANWALRRKKGSLGKFAWLKKKA